MAEAIRNHCLREINDEYILLTEYALLGQDWVRNFIRCHPQLQTVVGKSIESSRIEGTMPETLQKQFNEYKEQVIDDPNVLMENVYNMDESSFSIGSIKAGHAIVDLNAQSQFQTQPGCQEWVTAIETICVDGTLDLPSYIIFEGKDLNTKWILDNVSHNWRFSDSTNGTITEKIGFGKILSLRHTKKPMRDFAY